MKRVLVLFAHPAQRTSSINLSMALRARQLESVTLVDLYAEYPRFDIDIEREQHRLLSHDIIVLQFPLFWYSTPALLKQWQDLVLEYGFAYGPKGNRLAGKTMIASVTTGGSAVDYSQHGGNKHPFPAFLLPLRQTAELCGIRFLPPFVLHAANHIDTTEARMHIDAYPVLLESLSADAFDSSSLDMLSEITTKDIAKMLARVGA
ncbi:NAD(P)H-dependent oxidoreductase [Rhizobiaceae bacterium n13]|uniref:NAD(P)H-dependent oxidoreductase n=1 Tax=Ferirhizobium litorale TaxID=2927786 RepID=A0AAE3QAP1_9HYPH|nr:NAD(P)H-dependent oxidoreductase [Fererhizobium litorale]MDI7860348.1 NAD(P)H-dependent oxidoreductase [Fererhizobium litorale]MDI7920483.1 NAD(P)H-dependent oxidoreductase [Fererhizobium litorale]